MKAGLSAPWANADDDFRRAPTSGEVSDGFPCGPADMKLFNELFFRDTQLGIELAGVLAAAGLTPDAASNTQVLAALRILFAPAAPIYWRLSASAASIPHNLETQIGAFAANESHGAVTLNTSSGEVTVGAGGGGLYLIEAGFNALLTNTANRVWIRVNGAWMRTQGGVASGGSDIIDQSAVIITRLADADVITSSLIQTNGSSASRAISGSFGGYRIGN